MDCPSPKYIRKRIHLLNWIKNIENKLKKIKKMNKTSEKYIESFIRNLTLYILETKNPKSLKQTTDNLQKK